MMEKKTLPCWIRVLTSFCLALVATTVMISTASAAVDLTITKFSVTKKVNISRDQPIAITLGVKNVGTNGADVPATVTGTQNGLEVYRETQDVNDPKGKGSTKFSFPSFTPGSSNGDIQWTASVGTSQATASSKVSGGGQVQGTVTDTVVDPATGQHQVVVDATVVLMPAEAVEDADSIQPIEDTANAIIAGTNPNGFTATSDATGHYSMSGMPDGGYFLAVSPASNDGTHLYSAKREAVDVVGGSFASAGDGDIEMSQTPSTSANYVGASTCLTCHQDKQKIKKTLHFLGFRTVGATGVTEPNGLQDLNSTTPYPLAANAAAGLNKFTDPPTTITLAGTNNQVLLGKDMEGLYFQIANAGNPKYRVKMTYGGETGKWKMRYITIVGDDDKYPAGLWGPNNRDTAITGATGNGFGYFEMAPAQFQEKYTDGSNGVAGPFVNYHGDRWDFGPSGNDGTGLFTADVRGKSWDTNCAACHGGTGVYEDSTGDRLVQFPLDPGGSLIFDGSNNTYDINNGCEKCHGPGSEHVQADGNGHLIVQPDHLTPGRATQICGTCHIRGENKTALGGEPPLLGTSTGQFDTFRPGMSPATFFGRPDGSGIAPFEGVNGSDQAYLEPIDYLSNKASWQDKGYQDANQFVTPSAAGDRTQVTGTFNHSLGHHQQFEDVVRTKMYKNDNEMVTCFSCHDPHGSPEEHQLAANADNNAVCLACHNDTLRAPGAGEDTPDETLEGKHPANFQFISQADADALAADGTTSASIASEVMRHVGWWTGDDLMAAMDYDPDGSAGSFVEGSGRCTLCHMPKTAKSASFSNALLVDRSGNQYLQADIHSHTFDVTTTEAVNAMQEMEGAAKTTPAGMTNACGFCHASIPGIIN